MIYRSYKIWFILGFKHVFIDFEEYSVYLRKAIVALLF